MIEGKVNNNTTTVQPVALRLLSRLPLDAAGFIFKVL